jgi:hypothetical protein
MRCMRKLNRWKQQRQALYGLALLLMGPVMLFGQAPSYLGTKTPYVSAGVHQTPPPEGFQPVFINYVGRHGARYMTKAGADIDALKVLDAAERVAGLTGAGQRVRVLVKAICDAEKGHYENITLLGAAEQKAIGKRIFDQYNPALKGKGVEVVVTYKLRTQQSADAFLAGWSGYKVPETFSKLPDSLDAVLRFYDLSPAYQAYKKSPALKMAFDSLDRDRRTLRAAAAVAERLFTPVFRSQLKAEEELRFTANLYDVYSVEFSLTEELSSKDKTGLGIAFSQSELEWEAFRSGAQDFLEKGPGHDPLGIQVKVAAPLLAEFVRSTDRATGELTGAGGPTVPDTATHARPDAAGRTTPDAADRTTPDAILRFTHAEAISPFATLLGIPEASVPSASIYDYRGHWQAEKIIPLSANIQWIIYRNGKDYRVKVLLNEREVYLPLAGGPYYRWPDLRAWCLSRLKQVQADVQGDMLGYLKQLR